VRSPCAPPLPLPVTRRQPAPPCCSSALLSQLDSTHLNKNQLTTRQLGEAGWESKQLLTTHADTSRVGVHLMLGRKYLCTWELLQKLLTKPQLTKPATQGCKVTNSPEVGTINKYRGLKLGRPHTRRLAHTQHRSFTKHCTVSSRQLVIILQYFWCKKHRQEGAASPRKTAAAERAERRTQQAQVEKGVGEMHHQHHFHQHHHHLAERRFAVGRGRETGGSVGQNRQWWSPCVKQPPTQGEGFDSGVRMCARALCVRGERAAQGA